MGRKPKPYYWTEKQAWYCTIAGKRHRLAEGPDARGEAENAFHRLMVAAASPVGIPEAVKLRDACEDFLAHCQASGLAPGTVDQYRMKLVDFWRFAGNRTVSSLRPSDVTRWLATHPDWSDATRRGAITSLKVLCSWLRKERRIDFDPMEHVARPKMPRREAYLSPEERAQILEAVTEPFRSFLVALMETGARPGEIMGLEARHIDWARNVASFPGKTTRKTGELRTLYLNSRIAGMLRALAEQYPAGPLFRNSDGRAWTRNSVRCRMRRLPIKAIAYGFRHSYVTDALAAGLAPAVVAQLAGHRLTTTEGYAHLAERETILRESAERATDQTSP